MFYFSFNSTDIPLLIVILNSDFFYFYKFNYLEGWIRISYGYFATIKTMKLIQFNDVNYLMVIGENTATLIKIYLQGLWIEFKWPQHLLWWVVCGAGSGDGFLFSLIVINCKIWNKIMNKLLSKRI